MSPALRPRMAATRWRGVTGPQVAGRIREAYRRRVSRGLDSRQGLGDPAAAFIHRARLRAAVVLLHAHGIVSLGGLRIVDLGCGDGALLRDAIRLGADPRMLLGVDMLHERVDQARARTPGAPLVRADAGRLPVKDGAVDVALAFTLFSSITDEATRLAIAREAMRILGPGGLLVVYDFWLNPFNRDVRPLTAGDLRRLFAGRRLDLRRVTLAPPLTRATARRAPVLARLLERLPLLRSHYLAAVTKEIA